MQEVDLSNPVSRWLRERGLIPYAEVPVAGKCIDLVGRHAPTNTCVAVELKCSLTWRCIHQSLVNQVFADFAYCAVFTAPRQKGIDQCKRNGVGVLRVRDNVVTVLLDARMIWARGGDSYRACIVNRLIRRALGGEGGRPCEKGIGPAQAVAREIEVYRASHPKATWQELFESIPNHYASMESMRSSMYILAERLALREDIRYLAATG